MIKAICAHLFSKYDVNIKQGQVGENDYKIDKSTWVPMADVNLEVTKL